MMKEYRKTQNEANPGEQLNRSIDNIYRVYGRDLYAFFSAVTQQRREAQENVTTGAKRDPKR